MEQMESNLCLQMIHEFFKVLNAQESVAVVSEEVDQQRSVHFDPVDPVESVLAVIKLCTIMAQMKA